MYDLEKEGLVSIWFGTINNEEELFEYVDMTYEEDENGEFIPPQFFKDFKVDMDYVDEDFIERVLYDVKEDNINNLLEASSYSEVIIPNVCDSIGSKLDSKVNAKILIYNYEYQKEVCKAYSKGYSFVYYGCVKYIK